MFLYDISLNTCGSGKQRLPPADKWLSPQFAGAGDLIFSKFTETPLQRNDPKNWRDDFGEYRYDTRCASASIKKTPSEFYDFVGELRSELSADLQFSEKTQFAEWPEIYECLSVIHSEIDAASRRKSGDYHSLHLTDAAADSVYATNHYISVNFPKLAWRWRAVASRELYNPEYEYDEDGNRVWSDSGDDEWTLQHSLPERWEYGVDGDGDVTSVCNIRSLAAESVDLFTSAENSRGRPSLLLFGNILAAMVVLRKNGSAVIRGEERFDALAVSCLYLAAANFKRVVIAKPRSAERGVYVIGTGADRDDDERDELYQMR
jgi:hypothetical protein